MRIPTDKAAEMTGKGDEAPSAYLFAGLRLSTQNQSLSWAGEGGEPIALTSKLYHLLLTFAARPGEVLSKESIVELVWPGQVVTDAALAKQIQRLRSALPDTTDGSPLIETHWGRGYRFVCPVEPEYASRSEVASHEPLARDSRPKRFYLIASLVAALAVGIVVFQNSEVSEPSPAAVKLVPVSGQSDALSEGAAEYLAARFGSAAHLTPVLKTQAPPAQATDKAGLDLFTQLQAPVAAVRLERDEESYQVWVTLRSEDLISQATMRDASIHRLLERTARWVQEETPYVELSDRPLTNEFALSSYFEGLASTNCEVTKPFLRAAITSDETLGVAWVRLASCELSQGQALDAAATVEALLGRLQNTSDPALELDANLIAARAYRELGREDSAREHVERALSLVDINAVSPLRRVSALAGIAMLASLDGDADGALRAHRQRLEIARSEYDVPQFVAAIQLDIAAVALISGDYELMRSYSQDARQILEEEGDRELLLRSYRYLITADFRDNNVDAAAQLALAARPVLSEVSDSVDLGFFMQFAAIALNARGYLSEGREYTTKLRELETAASNPFFGVFADITVFHRLYAQGKFEEAYTFAASTRARLETRDGHHSALPQALAFEALGASRGASTEVARTIISRLEEYKQVGDFAASRQRAIGHTLIREGLYTEGLQALRGAESAYREIGSESVADYVGYEIVEARLEHEPLAPWDDVQRLGQAEHADFFLSRLIALAHARDGNLVAATAAMEKARLLANELWSSEDQLLLEQFRTKLASADAQAAAKAQ